jgi:hypothetical protein
MDHSAQDDARVSAALRQLEAAANNIATRLIKSAGIRTQYLDGIQEMSDACWQAYKAGELSAKAAAGVANEMRNTILDMSRANDFDLGRAYASSLKKKGLSLDEVVEYIMNQKKGFKERFKGRKLPSLSDAEQTEIFEEVIKSAGRDRGSITRGIPRLRWAARSLWILTAAIAIYNIGTAQNPWWQTGREGATLGGGLLGSIGGGAAMGAAGGVWAGPIGVGIGVLVGGILGALLADHAYVEAAGTGDPRTRAFISRFTSFWTGTDEEGMANALASEYPKQPDFVILVFAALEHDYSTDSDDVAYEYILIAQRNEGLGKAIKTNLALRACLVKLLSAGWTSSEEAAAIRWLQSR